MTSSRLAELCYRQSARIYLMYFKIRIMCPGHGPGQQQAEEDGTGVRGGGGRGRTCASAFRLSWLDILHVCVSICVCVCVYVCVCVFVDFVQVCGLCVCFIVCKGVCVCVILVRMCNCAHIYKILLATLAKKCLVLEKCIHFCLFYLEGKAKIINSLRRNKRR